MIYILLFLHFGFNVFFTMCVAAFIFTRTQDKYFEKISIFYLFVYSIVELGGVSFLLINGYTSAVWFIWMTAVLISFFVSLTLYFLRELDITMWGLFSVIFAPLILVPVLAFLLVANKIRRPYNKTG
jgi:hypothetical protein